MSLHVLAANQPNRTIPRRDLEFDLGPGNVPRDWCGDDPIITALVAGLSMVFPVGERFFVDSVKEVRDQLGSPELVAQVTGFVAQEAMHGREHRDFNQLLVAHGYTAATQIEARVGEVLRLVRRVFSPASQLAATSALEHFTAILAERLLGDESFRAEFHAAVRPLWLWHAYEEAEHKAVAFDVYRTIDGGELRRVLIMVLATIIFFAIMGIIQARLMAQRGVLLRPWRWLRGIVRLWIWPGHFTRMIPSYLAYYRPGFHPDDRDTSQLLTAWHDRLFGASGALRSYLRGTGEAA